MEAHLMLIFKSLVVNKILVNTENVMKPIYKGCLIILTVPCHSIVAQESGC